MCGIFCSIQDSSICTNEYIEELTTKVSGLLYHRGPDSMNYKVIECPNNKTLVMLHTRLHIVGNATPQPLMDESNTISLIINGEIFNWKELEKELEYKCSMSDCEIIIPLYKKYVQESRDFETFFSKINGQFSFVLYDSTSNYLFVSRDHIGITPLYCGYDEGKIAFSSELKCLTICTSVDKISFASSVKLFYPRTYIYTNLEECAYTVLLDRSVSYLNYYDLKHERNGYKDVEMIHRDLKYKLENSIKLQLEDLLNEDSPEFGILLSGGLDSSLVASIVSKMTSKKIKTFSIGISKNSSDLIASRKVAKFLDTEHYEFYFTVEEGLSSIRDVIWHTETYDTTTIRASTAMYLLTKKIKEKFPNLKVLFSGELSDEMLSYLYGANAPSETEFQMETVRLVSDVHMFDCLRSNKTCMANSIEVRVPFTDPRFIMYILKMPVKYKIFGKLNNYKTMEKQILRDSFNVDDIKGKPYLPKDILYRRKEAFSDGVSNHDNHDEKENWIDSLISHCDLKYGVISFLIKKDKYTYNKPETKEQLYYRETFCELFNKNSYTNTSEFTVKFWEPKWCGKNVDPSARKHIKEQFEIGSFEKVDALSDTAVFTTSNKIKKVVKFSHVI